MNYDIMTGNNSNFQRKKMKKLKGFTLIELMIVIVIVGIFSTVIVSSYQNQKNKNQKNMLKKTISHGESVYIDCIEGYKFITSEGVTKQIVDENKNGVKCSNDKKVNDLDDSLNPRANPYVNVN